MTASQLRVTMIPQARVSCDGHCIRRTLYTDAKETVHECHVLSMTCIHTNCMRVNGTVRARIVVVWTTMQHAAACERSAPTMAPFPDAPDTPIPACVFMTGVTGRMQSFLPGIRCIARRLRELGSAIPLVIAVPTTEMTWAKDALQAQGVLSSNVSLVSWNRFQYELPLRGHFTIKRWKDTRVLDKLAVLGAPYRRVVWLDSDVLLKRNVDHLCRAHPRHSFAAGLNHVRCHASSCAAHIPAPSPFLSGPEFERSGYGGKLLPEPVRRDTSRAPVGRGAGEAPTSASAAVITGCTTTSCGAAGG